MLGGFGNNLNSEEFSKVTSKPVLLLANMLY
ncbi:hypothetical protein LVISKB_1365 [Levilactobacillus brevis KB290]|uniref:Uncharacterized protein n=1 Tax=Levilactobacillus brevis KB290 TaxID=1001583 RepID=M5AF18_LEVBR|nr:hypothetical protein LVISKB_1365 [Levilactobacillus brevis KB290]